ncbi:expressed unknown protein [Seminavis robusta]|uniref:Uncharacterized protein n=1 Tax=Seminavis robusta TaxID=568900 RepID=A0A9N8HEL8_9STRA|nr:expressed unknown protein [Seminavis robusta]|eukprot:Sro310_g113940.1 n/a (167) ;mRNA; r:2327-2827
MSLLKSPVASSAKSTAPSPTRKPDGIHLDKRHLPRVATLQRIYKYAKKSSFVVLGSPPSTGKTSLLELLHNSLELKEANVIRYPIRSDDPVELIKDLADKGITKDRNALKKLKNTWLLIDDAQNAYDKKFNKFWEIVVKDGSAASSKGLFVVIARVARAFWDIEAR